ncbi:MAG: SH3 domain-containing protein [Alkalinema sp. FL-bin-369]|nr:SH3 domain-containing protein [Leptolyngbyaceae cyanobacterium LF-bin-369]
MEKFGLPKPALIIASLTGVAAIAGGTIAIVQPNENATPIVSSTTRPSTAPTLNSTTKTNPPTVKTAKLNPSQSERSQPETSLPAEKPASQPIKSSRTVENCETTMALVEDPSPPANIRSKPNGTSPDTIVGTVKNGTYLTVIDEQSDWYKISTPQKGWVAKRITAHGCNTKTERVTFGRDETYTALTDEFIGTGIHDYRLRLLKGQKLRVFAQKGPLPTIVAPNGRELNTLTDEAVVWSGTLKVSGDYKVIYNSNFKGYKYATDIEARS